MHFHDTLQNWSSRPGPLYARLAAAIRDAVERGDIAPGSPLPTERALAARLAIGRNTVVQAYAQLRRDALVESRQGSGTWVSGAPRQAVGRDQPASLQVAALGGLPTQIDLATAALPAHDLLRRLLRSPLDDHTAEALAAPGYVPAGLPALRAAIADRLSAEGLPTAVDEILITTGTQQAASLVFEHVLERSDTAVVEDPTSAGVLDVLHNLPVAVRGARPVTEAPDEFVAMIDRTEARLAYVVPTLGVTGQILADDARTRLARQLSDRSVILVEDRSTADLSFEPPPPPLTAARSTTEPPPTGSAGRTAGSLATASATRTAGGAPPIGAGPAGGGAPMGSTGRSAGESLTPGSARSKGAAPSIGAVAGAAGSGAPSVGAGPGSAGAWVPTGLAGGSAGESLVIGSLSKLHWGGLRIGWVRGPAARIAALARIKVRTDLGSGVLEQLLAIRLLAHEEEVRAERLATLRAALDHAAEVLPEILPEFSWSRPAGGLSLWLRLPSGTATAFSEVAARFGVVVVPGALLSPHGIRDDHLRLVYARPTDVFDEGVRRLAAAWRSYRGNVGSTTPVVL